MLVFACAVYWYKRPAAAGDKTLVKLTPLCDWLQVTLLDWTCCKASESKPTLIRWKKTVNDSRIFSPEVSGWCHTAGQTASQKNREMPKCSGLPPCKDNVEAVENLKDAHSSNKVVGPELSRQHNRAEQVTAVLQNNREVTNSREAACFIFRGDTVLSSDSSGHCHRFFTTSQPPLDSCIQNGSCCSITEVHGRQSECDLTITEGNQTVSKVENTDSSSANFHRSLGRKQSNNNVHEPNNEVYKTLSECAGHGQDETLGGMKSKHLAFETFNVVNKTQTSEAFGVPTGVNIGPSLAEVLQEERGGTLIRPEPSSQNTRGDNVNSVSLRRNRNDNGVSLFRGDTLPSSDSLEISPKFYTSSPTSTETHSPNFTNSQKPRSNVDHQGIRKWRNTDSSSSSSSTVRAGMLDSGEFHLSLGRQQSINDVHEPNNEVDELARECAGHGQDETLGGVKSKQFVSQTGSKLANDTPNGTGSGIPAGVKDSPSLSEHTNTSVKNGQFASETINVVNETHNSISVGVPTGVNIGPSLSEHTNTSGVGSQASGSSASTVQSGADCGSRSYPKGVPPREQAGYHGVPPGAEGVVKRRGPEVKYPVQESGLQCSSDLVVTVPVIPRRAGLVLGSDWYV